jgi:hypothetical protein
LKYGLKISGLRRPLAQRQHWPHTELIQDYETDATFESTAQKRSSTNDSLHAHSPHLMPGLGRDYYQENWLAKLREKREGVNPLEVSQLKPVKSLRALRLSVVTIIAEKNTTETLRARRIESGNYPIR